ncbi:methyltransferase domain-containing protein [Altererythrobacter aerius]|uniref:Methyltransferase domain-containing protein n=1 Tax=Tsuneonella aeria TaxID=1837929 RepID=A0A6I4TAZ0_9SPHN|nr:class I SAM-dependent methyltransferase [Tsuneonella aeria]MXO73847.1 methyltransferase domain-containing protein [Tsuneonella aeria]
MTSGTPPRIFDERRRQARAERSRRLQQRQDAPRWLAEAMAEDALDRIAFMRLTPARALVAGTGADMVAETLAQGGAEVTMVDAAGLDHERPYPFGGFDLIVSLAVLDTVNDLPGALIHQRAALAPGGVLVASMVGAGSLPRLRAALLGADGERPAARLHPAVDAASGAALLQRAGFARQVSDGWTLRLGYRDAATLVADLRAQGLTSVLADAPPPLTRSGWARARAAFLAEGDDAGRVIETIEILTLTGWHDARPD